MTIPPAFQFYPRDFLSSRAVLLMTPEERGGYIMLLCHAWLADEPGVLPNDDSLLAPLSGLGARWSECRAGIARAFTIADTTWTQDRMHGERLSQLVSQRSASAGGIARMNALDASERRQLASHAASVRWHKSSNDNGQSQRDANDARSASASASASASQNPSRTREEAKPPEGDSLASPEAVAEIVANLQAELESRWETPPNRARQI